MPTKSTGKKVRRDPVCNFFCKKCGTVVLLISCPTEEDAHLVEKHRPCPWCKGPIRLEEPTK